MCVAHKCYCKENGGESYNFLFPKMTHKRGQVFNKVNDKICLGLKTNHAKYPLKYFLQSCEE